MVTLHGVRMPSSKIIGILGEKRARDVLRDATPATEDDMANRWSGLVERAGQVDIGGPSYSEEMAQQNLHALTTSRMRSAIESVSSA